MASKYTENYGLCQWEATDQVLRTEFNADNAKVDAALTGLAEKDTSLEETLTDQATVLSSRGNCNIYTTFYVGTGGSGATQPTQVTMPEQILLLLVSSSKDRAGYAIWGGKMWVFYYTNTLNCTTSFLNGGKTVSWYFTNPAEQLNESGVTYYVTALTAADC